MSRTRMLLLLLAFAAATSGALAQTSPSPLDVLRRKSIFARDRVSRLPTTSHIQPTIAPVSLPVLVGIVREDDGFIAVFESEGGRLTPARLGQPLPGHYGIVTQISLDAVDYAPSTTQPSQRVLLGRDIAGAQATMAPTTPTTGAIAPIEGDDLVSRMRRRRQQESGR